MSYDGGDPSHLETAASCLEALGLRATFYAPPTRILEAPRRWCALSAAGHEIGNATLFDAAGPAGYLNDWTAEMVERDIDMAEDFHRELFGQSRGHSFAYPVPRREDLPEGEVVSIQAMQQIAMLRPIVRRRFAVARGSTEGYNAPMSCDALSLRCMRAFDYEADELILLAQQAVAVGAWVIFAFDGVGVGEPAVDAVEHAKLCLWLAEHRTTIHISTIHEIGCRIRKSAVAVVERANPHSPRVEARPTT